MSILTTCHVEIFRLLWWFPPTSVSGTSFKVAELSKGIFTRIFSTTTIQGDLQKNYFRSDRDLHIRSKNKTGTLLTQVSNFKETLIYHKNLWILFELQTITFWDGHWRKLLGITLKVPFVKLTMRRPGTKLKNESDWWSSLTNSRTIPIILLERPQIFVNTNYFK